MAASWTFLSHHAQVLICVARDPDVRLKDVAGEVGLSERSVQAIVNDLVDGGYLTRTRAGRRNHYDVCTAQPLRHPLQHDLDAGALLRLLGGGRRRRRAATGNPAAVDA